MKQSVPIPCCICRVDDTTLRYLLPVRDDQRGLFALDEWPVVQCQRCRLLYANPRPSKAALDHFYTFQNAQDQAFVQRWFIENADLQRQTWRRYIRTLRRYNKSLTGKLLDVGCGAGTFLAEARSAGFDVVGQEIAPFFVDYCRNVNQLTVHQGELETLPLEPNSFDVVTSFDVIEHHHDPQLLVQTMKSLLKPDGLLVVGTHDIGNLFARLYGKRWRYLQPIGHLTYFSRRTLSRLLQQNGFRILHVGGIHTVDESDKKELWRYGTQFVRVILLRLFILGFYKPLTHYLPFLTRWRLKMKDGELTHEKLLTRAGSQIIMNDNLLMLAVKEAAT